ncbi:MAG: hypothetical protein COA99_04405 [Moraxellaceae bacterium]|nr:MAG: hypothetical protein COA99_04405 [Moraxellaceae bacterium]
MKNTTPNYKFFPPITFTPKIAAASFAICLTACGGSSSNGEVEREIDESASLNGLWSFNIDSDNTSSPTLVSEINDTSVSFIYCNPSWTTVWQRNGNELFSTDGEDASATLAVSKGNMRIEGIATDTDGNRLFVLEKQSNDSYFNSGSMSLSVDDESLFNVDNNVCADYTVTTEDYFHLSTSAPFNGGRAVITIEGNGYLDVGEYDVLSNGISTSVEFYNNDDFNYAEEVEADEEYYATSGTISIISITENTIIGKVNYLNEAGLQVAGEFNITY